MIAAAPEGWRCLWVSPGNRPFPALVRALVPELSGDPETLQRLVGAETNDERVAAIGQWRRQHGEVLLVVDQFEELFTLNPGEVQEDYAALLGRLASEADVHVLVSLRDDFLMRSQEQAPLRPILGELTALLPLSAEALRRAVVEPAKKRGYRLRGRGARRGDGGVGGGRAGRAAAPGVCGVAALGEAGPGEEAPDAGGVRGRRRRGRGAGAARGSHDGPHRGRAAGGRARGLPEPDDGAGDAGGGGEGGAALGLPGEAGGRGGPAGADRRAAGDELRGGGEGRGAEPPPHRGGARVALEGVAAARAVAGAGRGGGGPPGPAEAGGAPLGGEGADERPPVDGDGLPGVRAVAGPVRRAP